MDSTQLSPAPNKPESTVAARGQLFQYLNTSLPINQYQLPDFVYRADLIPLNFSEYPPEQRVQIMDAASMEITFGHGYPALNEATPFWEKLPSEPEDAFNAFMVYLELPDKSSHNNPVRMLPMIAELTNIPLEDIVAYSHMYYWHHRGRAYDLFIIACHRKQREQRLMSIEGAHFKMAEDMLSKVQKLVDNKIAKMFADDDLDDFKLKDGIDSLQKLVTIQRISVGLPANGNTNIDLGPRHGQATDLMQHVAAESNRVEESSQRSPEMDKLLANPEDLAAVQDLITRLHTGGNA